MKQNKFKVAKKLSAQYSKTIINSIVTSFFNSFNISFLIANYKIISIKSGEYPGQHRDIINKQLNEAKPKIIVEAVIMCLLIMIVLSILMLILRFRVVHDIYLVHEFKLYLKEKKTCQWLI